MFYTFNMQHARYIVDFYRIAGALTNRYHPVIHMADATVDLAQQLLLRSQTSNVVQARVEADNLIRRNGQRRRRHQDNIQDFPVLDLAYLRELTVGVYQVNLSPSYIQDKVVRENDEEFQLDEHIAEPGYLRVSVYSRFRNATRHQIFIVHNNIIGDGVEGAEDAEANDRIIGYYCTCQSGTRTFGSCAHVASILWFLGYARRGNNIRYPDNSLLNTTLDARNEQQEGAQENINIEVIDKFVNTSIFMHLQAI